jgi:hypothetical protein
MMTDGFKEAQACYYRTALTDPQARDLEITVICHVYDVHSLELSNSLCPHDDFDRIVPTCLPRVRRYLRGRQPF